MKTNGVEPNEDFIEQVNNMMKSENESFMKQMNGIMQAEESYRHASEAIKDDNINALAYELSNHHLFTQEKINKLLIMSLVYRKTQCTDYLKQKNSSPYIADINACTTSAAKHICVKGDLEFLKDFLLLYNIDINQKGSAESYTTSSNIYSGGTIMPSMKRTMLNMETPLPQQFDLFTYAVKNQHIHIMKYLIDEHQYSCHNNFETAIEVAADNNNQEVFDLLLQNRPASACFSQTLLIAIINKNVSMVQKLLHNQLVNVNDIVVQEPKDTDIIPLNFFLDEKEAKKNRKEKIFNALNLALRFFDKDIVDLLLQNGAKIHHYSYIAIQNVTNYEAFEHLVVNHNLPNNPIVQQQLKNALSVAQYDDINAFLNARDLAQQLDHELPSQDRKPLKRKI